MTRRQGWGLLARVLLGACLLTGTLIASPNLQAAPDGADLERARERLIELERDFELVVERYNLVHGRLEELQAEIAAKELVVGTIERRMASKIDAAVSVARGLFKSGTTRAPVTPVLSS